MDIVNSNWMTEKFVCNFSDIGSWMWDTEVNENTTLGTWYETIFEKKKDLCPM